MVVSQGYSAGDSVNTGTTIDIVVSHHEPESTTKATEKESTTAATQTTKAAANQ